MNIKLYIKLNHLKQYPEYSKYSTFVKQTQVHTHTIVLKGYRSKG